MILRNLLNIVSNVDDVIEIVVSKNEYTGGHWTSHERIEYPILKVDVNVNKIIIVI